MMASEKLRLLLPLLERLLLAARVLRASYPQEGAAEKGLTRPFTSASAPTSSVWDMDALDGTRQGPLPNGGCEYKQAGCP